MEEDPLFNNRGPVKFKNLRDDGEVDIDKVKALWPLRLAFQLLGLWQPSGCPKFLSWSHYLVFFGTSVWYSIWKINFLSTKHNIAIGLINGFDHLLFQLLWIFVPLVLYTKGRQFVNCVEYIIDNTKELKFSFIHSIVFALLLIPQLTYCYLIELPYIQSNVVPAQPWDSPSTNTFNLALLMIGLTLETICINTSILFLGIAAHAQTYQINDFLENHLLAREALKIDYIKHTLHLTVKTLGDGNRAFELLNCVVVSALIVATVELLNLLYSQPLFDFYTLLPLLLLLIQSLLLIIPAAYTTSCWNKIHDQCLELHALSLAAEDEITPVIMYINRADMAYYVAGTRMDFQKVFWFCMVVLIMLSVKVKMDISFVLTPELK